MTINWTEQWETFAPNFKEGKAYIDLSPYGKELSFPLIPGAGFGDFSHPTTQMSLELLASACPGRHVVDLGSGSGILSIAAYHLGAASVVGVEIDPDAIAHATQNARLNGAPIPFIPLPKRFPSNPLIVMNMISSEQEILLPYLPEGSFTLIVSGIIEGEEEVYLNRKLESGFILIKSLNLGCWNSFVLTKKSQQR